MSDLNLRALFLLLTRKFGFLSESCNEQCCGSEVSLIQSHILFEINRLSQPSIQEVARSLHIDITTFSRQIKGLVKKGLVQKTPDPKDHRIQMLSLTKQGEVINHAIEAQVITHLEEVLSHLSSFERDTVIRSIKLLNEAMLKSPTCCTPIR